MLLYKLREIFVISDFLYNVQFFSHQLLLVITNLYSHEVSKTKKKRCF